MVRARPGSRKDDRASDSGFRNKKDKSVAGTNGYIFPLLAVGITFAIIASASLYGSRRKADQTTDAVVGGKETKQAVQSDSRGIETLMSLAKSPDASVDVLREYLVELYKQDTILQKNKAPADVRLFLQNEMKKLFVQRLPWHEVIEDHAKVATEAIEPVLRAKDLYADCCTSYDCSSAAVKLVMLLKQTNQIKKAEEIVDYLAKEQQFLQQPSCRGVQWSDGMHKLVSPLNNDFPIHGYMDVAQGRTHPAPFWEAAEVPMAAFLEEHSTAILAEADEALHTNAGFGHHNLHVDLANSADSWSTLNLFTDGKWDETNCEKLPRICALLKERTELQGLLRTSAGEDYRQLTFATIYRLRPPAKIHRHCGNPWRLNVHMGLKTPPGASIRVWGEKRQWQRGKTLTFLDASEHEVEFLEGAEDRFVLNVVVWHPDVMSRRSNDPQFADLFE